MVLSLFLKPLACQQPNTDGFFVSQFLQKMGLSSSQLYNFSAPVCSWKGVFCDAKKEYVIGLDVSRSELSGSIPDTTIGKLTKLQTLELSNNKITGLPSDLWSLGSLKYLNLSHNQISGSLPNNIGNFGLLESFDLSSNNFSGEIPAAISSLISLRVLKLSQNWFEKSIPSGIGSVVGVFKELLEVVDLSRNQFQGHISQVQFNTSYNWSHLVYLDLSENQLGGEILHNWNQAQNLKHLNLADNRFTRQEFPRNMEMLLGLEYLNLSKTSLTGRIPAEVSKLSNLNTLDLSQNHLIGHVPLLSIRNLQVFDVSFNNLSGEIPASLLEKLPWMERFNFSYNNLTLCASEISLKPSKHLSLVRQTAAPLQRTRRKTRMWEVKQPSYKEEQNISGPFSFQTDSTTWVADVKQATSVPVVIFEKPLLNFTFSDLLSATSNFDRGTLLAEGKFGPVYRGFLPGGIHVAVKVLVHGSTLTDQETAREFEYLGRIKHPNLVPLTGYCLAGDQRIAIYDYMENGNLQNLLYDLPLGVQTTEDWSTDTWEEDDNNGIQNVGSEGDVKASSVYLDYNLEPRLSDFGLAKIFGNGLDEEISRGSPGYLPPEFSQPEYDTPTPKSDVYCFGVVLFELITGKKPIGDDYPEEKDATLVSWVRGLVKKNRGASAIDPKIRDTGPDDQMEEALKIGYLCTADLPLKRPSMHQIVGLLKDMEQTGNQ
ncbi:putative LRR receptor-like serine/threonine-protein kinase [Prunus yedoensis var. nudiflora]|uniref:Putative LRR receptor-like serine/threonine-protein kinase n=1 Tax=Prunus yedoensis var. nudiflora TaxID=2094558 RepID=A0A314Y0P9_PRUYE|nr:putative LRR receptor-like serine/threonine-protein kinase [Prunus yedoensis var. nudiflora]